jgi:soluble lytic murein transglycosylase
MGKDQGKNIYCKTRTSLSRILFIVLYLLISLMLIFSLSGCGIFEGEFFGKKFGESAKSTDGSSPEEIDDLNGVESGSEVSSGNSDGEDQTDEESGETEMVGDAEDNGSADENQTGLSLEELRFNFTEAMVHFGDGSFLIAEYYLNRIENNYLVLQDHILYYKAKSLLMQGKYGQSEEHYNKVVDNFPDSIWTEKASLEIADLYYIQEDYISAEEQYSDFLSSYPESEYVPYAKYQKAVCLANNVETADSFSSFKDIWLENPSNEYASLAYRQIEALEESGLISKFVPSPEELFKRGENLFYSYHYQDAINEFNRILDDHDIKALSSNIYSETCFKLGMSYYNMSDYKNAESWLTVCYEEAPESSVTHASLFFLGRAHTNLGNNSRSINYYEKLLNEYPSSSYGDDALYRMGRLYSVTGDTDNAIESFGKVFEIYPSGDKTDESLWELGWIQYREGHYTSAKTTFSNISSRYKGTLLEEKALFWKANTCRKLGDSEAAVDLCKQIVNISNYSYYTFAAAELAKELGTIITIPPVDNKFSPGTPGLETFLPDIFENLNRKYENIDGRVDHITKAIELLNLGFNSSASLEIESGSSVFRQDPKRVLEIATFYYEARDFSSCQKVIYSNLSSIRSGLSGEYLDYAYYLYYPYGFEDIVNRFSADYELDPLFTLAVMRQESSFRPDAGSYAGARGLMQIMPATGAGIAKQIGLSGYQSDMLTDPEINIQMGTYYLRQQLDNFDENPVYCLGAYNGGPGAMSGWVSKWGGTDTNEFIENITYLETREYIKKVMGNYYFYQMLYP